MRIGVALKLVARRPEVDLLTAAVIDDTRSWGASPADQAALEWALRAGDTWGAEVLAVSAGGPEAVELLQDALAAGATSAIHVQLASGAESEAAAAALATMLEGCDLVWCGDYSLDRGSGSVPAYLAAHLAAAQALGLVQVELGEPGVIRALRRLDGGRRERLLVQGPAVVSVEGSTARLRRASLGASLGARARQVETVPGPAVTTHSARVTRPFRPRARTLPPPAGQSALDRIVTITDAHGTPGGGDVMTLEPGAAAERILDALAVWGYRDQA